MKHKITGAREAPQMPGFDQDSIREYGVPGGGGYFWILFFIAAAIIVATQVKKETSDLNIPSNDELFEKLPDDAKEAFKEKYGQPDEDDSECELYYLLAKSTMKRPCAKCPVWCMDPGKTQILVSEGEIYYIGKTCRKEGKREKEHKRIRHALNLDYKRIKRGTEGYITKTEQLHLKTYFTKEEAIKEGCRLFLPPGNTIGMSQQDWKKLLEELQ
ncbi:MAG: hypothetical protein J5I98_25945 [Phaeodactylibacter sp.]|nr:hypothetical protein [Phaeodactylibacter sp.]